MPLFSQLRNVTWSLRTCPTVGCAADGERGGERERESEREEERERERLSGTTANTPQDRVPKESALQAGHATRQRIQEANG